MQLCYRFFVWKINELLFTRYTFDEGGGGIIFLLFYILIDATKQQKIYKFHH